MSRQSTLWYFADPMCSWCWGFSPVLEQIKSNYAERINIALMMGGLRPGTVEPISNTMREEILHHWRAVQKMTGQAFSFEGALPEGFVYDTEPACRAVIALAELKPEQLFSFFRSIQSAFYIDQIDVTKAENLAALAVDLGVTAEQFLVQFSAADVREKTRQHFQGTRQAGVSGFPSLVVQQEAEFQFIAKGYRPFDEIAPLIEVWLDKHPSLNS